MTAADDLTTALSERILNAELDEHRDEERAAAKPNRRNGLSKKKTMMMGTAERARIVDPAPLAFPCEAPHGHPVYASSGGHPPFPTVGELIKCH